MIVTGIEWLRQAAREYNASVRLSPPIEGHYVEVDKEVASEIAAYYQGMPTVSNDPETLHCYRAFVEELEKQWAFAQPLLHMEAWKQNGQPYANSREMIQDVEENHHLYYFTGGEPHPFISADTNNKFRALHDIWGHAAEGFGFGPRGEQNAWLHHSMMFSPEAQRALTTETRGQNSWFYYGPYAHVPIKERPFAVQKAALLPEKWCEWRKELATCLKEL